MNHNMTCHFFEYFGVLFYPLTFALFVPDFVSPNRVQATGSLDMDDLDDSRRSTASAAAASTDAPEPARSRSQPHIRSHDGYVTLTARMLQIQSCLPLVDFD